MTTKHTPVIERPAVVMTLADVERLGETDNVEPVPQALATLATKSKAIDEAKETYESQLAVVRGNNRTAAHRAKATIADKRDAIEDAQVEYDSAVQALTGARR